MDTNTHKPALHLPIGVSDFSTLRTYTTAEGYHYDFVDKTLLIKTLLNEAADVCLMLRPRRFGKTLNLSMLQHFFAKSVKGKATADLFSGLNITRAGPAYMAYQGQYPVIFLSLKCVEAMDFQGAAGELSDLMAQLYSDHAELLESDHLTVHQKAFFELILAGKANKIELGNSLENLVQYLYQHYQKEVWLLIDEYDTPVQIAYQRGYYEEMAMFMRVFLGGALKDNPLLYKGVVTGIFRVSTESLFSGLNNLEAFSFLSREYGDCFGFTETEVKDLLDRSNCQVTMADIKHWYNGYQARGLMLYNPWSIIHCLEKQGKLQPYWINTSDNTFIKELISDLKISVKRDFEQLIQGHSLEKRLEEGLVFGDLKRNETALWSFLFLAGYLKVSGSKTDIYGAVYQVSLPNFEVSELYREMVAQWLSDANGLDTQS